MQEGNGLNISRDKIERIVKECLDELLVADLPLLQHDVSERAIAHKLAEYLQCRFHFLNVDCEYNRNTLKGWSAPKAVYLLDAETRKRMKSSLEPDELLAVSAYPDIIVHRRLRDDKNLLIVEIKKRNSKVDHDHDFRKLRAFTENSEQNSYHFRYGVFILLDTNREEPSQPEMKWFAEGEEEQKPHLA